MKVKIVGDGELTHDYLTIGKVYDVVNVSTGNAVNIIDDDGDEVTVNTKAKQYCGFLEDATGNLKWEIVEGQ